MKTTEDFFNEMTTEQANYEALSGLDSTSGTSTWGMMKKLFAYMAAQLSVAMDNMVIVVNSLMAEQQVGTEDWYKKQLRAFQYGDNIVVVNNRITYTALDTAKQIVKDVALEQVGGIATFKVITKASSGERSKLTDEALAALQYYMSKVKFLGTELNVISLDGDMVFVKINVKVNRLLVSMDGSLIGNSSVFPILNSVKEWLENRPFNSTHSNMMLQDYLLTLPWVQEVNQVVCSYTPTGGTLTTKDYYKPISGYLVFDNSSLFEYVY